MLKDVIFWLYNLSFTVKILQITRWSGIFFISAKDMIFLLKSKLNTDSMVFRTLFLWRGRICILYACTDEIHQLFVPERYGLMDVLIDSIGISLGLLFFFIFFKDISQI